MTAVEAWTPADGLTLEKNALLAVKEPQCQHRLKTDPPYRSKTDPPRRYLKSVYSFGEVVSRGTTWPDFSLSFSR